MPLPQFFYNLLPHSIMLLCSRLTMYSPRLRSWFPMLRFQASSRTGITRPPRRWAWEANRSAVLSSRSQSRPTRKSNKDLARRITRIEQETITRIWQERIVKTQHERIRQVEITRFEGRIARIKKEYSKYPTQKNNNYLIEIGFVVLLFRLVDI